MDREKVIHAVETAFELWIDEYTGCSWFKEDEVRQAKEDALALLKEQEAVKPVRDEQTGRLWLCGNCGSYVGFEDNDPHDPNEFDKYCRECGRPVLWEGR